MLLGKNTVQETYYDILSVREDANIEEIRTSYRSAILSSHPDKLHNDLASEDRFLKVQKAWEILGNSRSRAVYDTELRASREDDAVVAEDVKLEDMMVEDDGRVLSLFYQCRCGDYFSVDSSELEEMGYRVLRDGNKISLKTLDTLAASVVFACISCSLKIRLLLINWDIQIPVDDDL